MRRWLELVMFLAIAAVAAGAFCLGEAIGEDKARRLDSFELRWVAAHDGGAP